MRAHPPSTSADHLLAEGRALHRLARSLLDDGDVDDVLQDAAVAAMTATPRRPGPWLRAMLRNLALLRRRSAARRRRREREVARPVVDGSSDPAAIAAQAELMQRVVTAVRELEEPFRTVVVLRFWRGLLPEAIAQELGVPRNTVRSRLQRGIERLRERLDGAHGDRAGWSAPLAAAVGLPAPAAATAVEATLLAGMMMKTKLLVGAAALLAALLLWGLAARPAAEAPRTNAQVPSPVAAAGNLDRVADAPAVERLEVRAAPAAAAADSEVVVLVRDAATHAPVAGATVLGPSKPDNLSTQPELEAPGSYGQAEYYQWLLGPNDDLGVTGEDGTVRVRPRCRGTFGYLLVARCGDRLGSIHLSSVGKTATIDLHPDQFVTVRALDQEGRPVAGLPIAARGPTRTQPEARIQVHASPLGLTDAHGELRFARRLVLTDNGGFPEGSSIHLVPYLPGVWQHGGVLLPKDASAAPLVLPVPPLGSMNCEWLDADGEVADRPLLVVFDEAAVPGAGTAADPDIGSMQWRMRFLQTRGFWPYWGLGQQLAGRCEVSDETRPLRGSGPQHRGGTAMIQVRADPDGPVLVGRLLDTGGSPIRQAALSARCETERSRASSTLWTDALGRFEWTLDAAITDEQLRWLMLALVHPGAGDARGAAWCEQPFELMAGKLDLGDLRMSEPPLVLSGRVAAEGVNPETYDLSIKAGTPSPNRRMDATLAQLLLTKEKDGSFSFRGFAARPPLVLVVSGPAFVEQPPIPFTPGTTGLVVQVTRTGSIEARLEVPKLDSGMWYLRVVEEATGTELDDHHGWRHRVGRFTIPGLRPGSYTLQLRMVGDPEPACEVTGIHVAAGESTRDPRLLPLRLPVLPHRLLVRASAAGKPVNGCVLVGPVGASRLASLRMEDGLARVWTLRDTVDLWVLGSGFAPVFLPASSTDVQVDLTPPRELRLQFDAPRLPSGFVLRWTFELLQPDPRIPQDVLEYFGHSRTLHPAVDGSCRVPVLSDQPCRVVCCVHRQDSDSSQPVPVEPAELPANATETRLSVRPPDLQRALQMLPDRDR